ncbi:class I SAM-dependent methyltransferase [Halobacteria archaeon AArc-m2/3/4]|uniref:Class I SAM-dependent methyltransferase n=1 Tax=Natronoglomus mannanivorans TaxID=2979990 RepID=A0AAP2YY34_9EURY|nr:class I SAM-dependent methyltransferase [Halobacteria archaeon AArc-xg1-1]MCU4973246.1 class I SAM-dependent methyltransferase [Halobacteria archaeon AArc-m2/3/4]
MVDALGLIERGLNRPDKIPRYVVGLLIPSSNWGPEWRRRGDVVQFEPGGYASSPRTRPEFASNLYHEVAGLGSVLDDHLEGTPERSIEVGCGYGRLSPWIAEYSEDHVGVDPDEDALERAVEQYGDIDSECGAETEPEAGLEFVPARADSIPFPDDSFDLLVTWTVLQHVPDEVIRESATELRRVLSPDGLAVCCERLRPPADDHIWPRSLETYQRLFEPLELVDVRERPVEPTWAEAMDTMRPAESVLVFRG